jgi:hypothetical protein
MIAGSLLAVTLALLSAAIASLEGFPGALAVLALWAAYLPCFVLYGVKRFKGRWVLLGGAVMMIVACAFFALPLGGAGADVAVGLGLGLISHIMFLIAARSMRQADLLFDADRWARNQLARGLCPQCGYDLRGLPHRRCPECGTTWSAEEMIKEVGEAAPSPRLG